MSKDTLQAERTAYDVDRDGVRRRYRAPSLAKGPKLATVTASDGTISGLH
jgi:hypothetical protein